MQKKRSSKTNNNQTFTKSLQKRNSQTFIKSTDKDKSKTKQKQQKSRTIDSTAKFMQSISKSPKIYQRSLIFNQNNDNFESQLDFRCIDLKKKKQKMYTCIDLFNLMQSNNMQIRCIEHNNILSLYCVSERRILCVNCTFGGNKHKTHKIIPLKDSSKLISQDNQLLKDIINTDLRNLQQGIKNCQQNSFTLQRQMKKTLNSIQQQFQKKFDDLKARYQYETTKLKNVFESLIEKNKLLEKDMQQFKFKIWQTLSKIGIGRRNQLISNETQIIRQVFCVNISQLTKFLINKISKRQLQKLVHKAKS